MKRHDVLTGTGIAEFLNKFCTYVICTYCHITRSYRLYTLKGAGSYLAGMAVAIPILNVDGRRHTNNFSKNI